MEANGVLQSRRVYNMPGYLSGYAAYLKAPLIVSSSSTLPGREDSKRISVFLFYSVVSDLQAAAFSADRYGGSTAWCSDSV